MDLVADQAKAPKARSHQREQAREQTGTVTQIGQFGTNRKADIRWPVPRHALVPDIEAGLDAPGSAPKSCSIDGPG